MKIIPKGFITIVLLALCFQAKSQNAKDTIFKDNSISAQLYTKCFKNLNQGAIIFEKYPNFKRSNLCSLSYCMLLLSFRETEIQLAAEDLLRGIAIQLYREGNPVCMISGMDSYTIATNKNENLEDDDHLVYISYAECVSPYFLSRGANVINEQTRRLIVQSKSKNLLIPSIN